MTFELDLQNTIFFTLFMPQISFPKPSTVLVLSTLANEKSQFRFMKPGVPETDDVPTQLDLSGNT